MDNKATRHIAFTADEEAMLQQRAEEAGMGVNAYIRHMALNGSVRCINWDALRQHNDALEYITEKINIYTSNHNPNMWLFEADLHLILEELALIRTSQEQLIEIICKDE